MICIYRDSFNTRIAQYSGWIKAISQQLGYHDSQVRRIQLMINYGPKHQPLARLYLLNIPQLHMKLLKLDQSLARAYLESSKLVRLQLEADVLGPCNIFRQNIRIRLMYILRYIQYMTFYIFQGVYRLQYVDRSRTGKGRATFKHIERDLFLYYIKDSQVTGWIIGPKPGISIGGLFINVSNVQFCIAGVLAACTLCSRIPILTGTDNRTKLLIF